MRPSSPPVPLRLLILVLPGLMLVLPGLMSFGLAGPVRAEIHRCEKAGEVVYADQPCEPGARASRQRDAAPGTSGALDLQVALTHYRVEGRTYDALARSLNANGPNGFHGLASWRISFELTTTPQADQCRVASVVTRVSGKILMPQWVDEASAPRALQRRWTAYYAALKRHEDGHIQHGRELALLVKEKLMGIGAVACDTLQAQANSEFQRLYGHLKTRDQQYDARTDHGATQGALF